MGRCCRGWCLRQQQCGGRQIKMLMQTWLTWQTGMYDRMRGSSGLQSIGDRAISMRMRLCTACAAQQIPASCCFCMKAQQLQMALWQVCWSLGGNQGAALCRACAAFLAAGHLCAVCTAFVMAHSLSPTNAELQSAECERAQVRVVEMLLPAAMQLAKLCEQ